MAAKWRHIRWPSTYQLLSPAMDYDLPKFEFWVFISFWAIEAKAVDIIIIKIIIILSISIGFLSKWLRTPNNNNKYSFFEAMPGFWGYWGHSLSTLVLASVIHDPNVFSLPDYKNNTSFSTRNLQQLFSYCTNANGPIWRLEPRFGVQMHYGKD